MRMNAASGVFRHAAQSRHRATAAGTIELPSVIATLDVRTDDAAHRQRCIAMRATIDERGRASVGIAKDNER